MFNSFLSTRALREHSRERKKKENQEEEEEEVQERILPISSSLLFEEELDGKSPTYNSDDRTKVLCQDKMFLTCNDAPRV